MIKETFSNKIRGTFARKSRTGLGFQAASVRVWGCDFVSRRCWKVGSSVSQPPRTRMMQVQASPHNRTTYRTSGTRKGKLKKMGGKRIWQEKVMMW